MLIKRLTPEQELAWNLAVRNSIAGTARQQLGKQGGSKPLEHRPKLSANDAPNGSFEPTRALVQRAYNEYRRASFLGAPSDGRLLIYCFMEDDTKTSVSDSNNWSQKPQSPYNSLRLVCRQIYHELEATEWQHWLVPQNRINELSTLHFFKEGINYNRMTDSFVLKSKSFILKAFQSLAVEIPFDVSGKRLMHLMIAIQTLPLNELKLYFTGSDGHDNPTRSTVSCCLRPERSSRKLPSTGQRFNSRARFVNSLMKLANLETLVISNANLPVTYNQVANNKPRLQKLSIVPDSRTALTYDWDAAAQSASNALLQSHVRGSNIKLNVKNMPPLRELEISANSMVFSSAVVKNALPSLEKLTWIVPNPNHQHGDLHGRDLNWLEQTRKLLQHAAIYARNQSLKTLRICIEHSIYDSTMDLNRNDEYEVGELVNSLLSDIKNISTLRNLELHMDYVCRFKNEGFLFPINLGGRLERYFMSEKMITASNEDTPHAYVGVVEDEFKRDSITSEDANVHIPAALRLSVHHYLVRQVTRDAFVVPSFSAFKFKSDTLLSPLQEEALSTRTDRIKRPKCLAFLAYEYTDMYSNVLRIIESTDTAPISPAYDLPEDDEDRFRLLRLNGRLLDRERNKHLYMNGYRPQRVEDMEDEQAADPAQLPARRYPVVVRVKKGDHWMCEI